MKKFLVFAFAAAMTLAACGHDDTNPTSGGNDNTDPDNGGKKDDGKLDAGCNFAKEDNVWKYKYSTWEYIDEYTWVDETTVDYKAYKKAYHMEDDDTTYTGVNRDEFFEKVMEDCLFYQNMDN